MSWVTINLLQALPLNSCKNWILDMKCLKLANKKYVMCESRQWCVCMCVCVPYAWKLLRDENLANFAKGISLAKV